MLKTWLLKFGGEMLKTQLLFPKVEHMFKPCLENPNRSLNSMSKFRKQTAGVQHTPNNSTSYMLKHVSQEPKSRPIHYKCVSTQAVAALTTDARAESFGDDGDDTATAQALQHTCNGQDDIWHIVWNC